MAKNGQKFQHYSLSLKVEAVRLHEEEKWTYRQINEHLGIRARTVRKNG
jgi:DNA-directed RNA polymerase specialized sigma24 family protein